VELRVIDQRFSICKLKELSQAVLTDEFSFAARTDEEISLVCSTNSVPKDALKCDHGWKAFRIEGEVDFALVGVLAKIAGLLAENGIPIFAVSTYNTDYILTKEGVFPKAISILEQNGYTIKT